MPSGAPGWADTKSSIASPTSPTLRAVAKAAISMQSSVVDQLMVARYLETVDLDAHVARVSAVYRERRDAMSAAISPVLPDGAHVTRPEGGMFLWAALGEGYDAQEMLDTLIKEKWLRANGVIGFFPANAVGDDIPVQIGGGIRSLNVALRQELDLYACVRPVRYFEGVPSPVKHPELTDMVIFRENTEDIYAGIEYMNGTPQAQKMLEFLQDEMGVKKIRFPESSSFGIKPVSKEGTDRLVRAAIKYALEHKLPSVTLVHKGNIMKFTEGGFRDWAYDLAKNEFGGVEIDGGPWCQLPNGIVIKDVIADNFLQQILLRPRDYDVIATLNLNGDYLSDALAAQVGGIGIAPGANINYVSGHSVFEATHGTAPKYAGQDVINPSSVILSGEMMLRYMGWTEAADLILKGMDKTIGDKTVTYDFARGMDGARQVKTSEFGDLIIQNM